MLMITPENYGKDVLKAKGVVLVDHYADWCGPCKLLAPIFGRLAEKYAGKAVFAKLDVDAHPDIASQNSVMGIPTIVAFKNGKEIDRLVGLPSEAALEKKLESWLKA